MTYKDRALMKSCFWMFGGLALGIGLLFFFEAMGVPQSIQAKMPERAYQEKWCQSMQGKAEVVLPDGARVDCLTEEYAVEVDFAYKWAEAIGQCLYYASQTGRKPGILLITNEKSQRYLDRLWLALQFYSLDVKVWTVEE